MPVSFVPVFLKYRIHSTAGYSLYSIDSQRTCRPVAGSVYVVVRAVLPSLSLFDVLLLVHLLRKSPDGFPA